MHNSARIDAEPAAVSPIIVGTDGSTTAERAVEKAGELAAALGAIVHVVTSCGAPTSAWMAGASGLAIADTDLEARARQEGETALSRALERLNELGVESRTHVCSGEPAQALITIAADEGAQMIVVGNRGMSGARRVLGSVPNRVSHHAGCAVLIVPTG